MLEKRGHEVIPSAKRLIHSLRDLGYDFAQAVADVVDNSIEAGASEIEIDVKFEGDDSWIRIVDNGRGMTVKQLREAMRYGAERDYKSNDLGKFGLGLKTASMSQCQCLTVASRSKESGSEIVGYSWDLDHIERTNRWEILPVDHPSILAALKKALKNSPGTVVVWQRLDRILGYQHPYGENARKRLLTICREIEQHLGMVFHRFISGEVPEKSIKLTLNKNPIRAWDPFCSDEPKRKKLRDVTIPILHEGVSSEVNIEPFVLPHQDDFSTTNAFRQAGGPANWNQQQGFYIYRAGRMIQSGGWSGLRTVDEHMKLARIALNFAPELDDAFKINVAKMRVQLPSVIREAVRNAIGPVVKLAREVYDKKSGKTPPPNTASQSASITSTTRSPTAGNTNSSVISAVREGSKQVTLLTFEQWSEQLLTKATNQERPVVEAVLRRLHSGNAQ